MTESRPRIIRRHDTDAATIGDLLRKSRGSFVDSVRYAIEAGHRLKAKKAELKQRGEQWLPWLKANAEVLGFGEAPERQAQRLMRAAEKYDAGVVFGEAEAVHISREIYGHLPPPSAVLRQRPTTVTQSRESLAPTRPTRRELAELEGLRVPVPQLERAASTPNTTTRKIVTVLVHILEQEVGGRATRERLRDNLSHRERIALANMITDAVLREVIDIDDKERRAS